MITGGGIAVASVTVSGTNGAMTVNGGVGPEYWVPPATGTGSVDTTTISAVINAINAAGAGSMRLPPCTAAGADYNITSALPVITVPINIHGAGSGLNGNGPVTLIQFAAGLPGLQFNSPTGNSSGSLVENIWIQSLDNNGGTNYGTVNNDHGIDISASQTHATTLRKVQIVGFGGDGVHQNSFIGGNSIGSKFEQVRVLRTAGNGFYFYGNNASVNTLDSCDVANAGLWAYNLNAPGNLLLNCQTINAALNPGRNITDGVTNGTTTYTSATANFTSADQGVVITGTNLAANTSIVAINSSSNVTLNQNATGSGTGGSANIQAGGAILDQSLGNTFINFYAEEGQGSNVAFDTSSSAHQVWISGEWTSAWFSVGPPETCIYGGGNATYLPPFGQVNVGASDAAGRVIIEDGINPQIQLRTSSGSSPQIQLLTASGTSTITPFSNNGWEISGPISVGGPGGSIRTGLATPAYGSSVNIDAYNGNWHTITVTNNTAFSIAAPAHSPSGAQTQELTVEVLNSSGGAMGAITWDPSFVFAGQTWTNPANGKHRHARFEWNGNEWVCTGVAAADYA